NFNRTCERNHEKKDISEYQKRINLITYCINRDYIKRKCEVFMNGNIPTPLVCYVFDEFIKKHYTRFYDEKKCFDVPLDHKDYSYHISDDCTLYNMDKTFPKINVQDKKIVYADVSRKRIEQCKHAEKVADGYTRSENRPLESKDLGFSSLVVVNSPDNKPLKQVYYSGLSVLGVVFTSMVLYKVKNCKY
ncbi:hypothetical protein PCYB_004870, partial [Plasmodium cynomolgi strain B]